MKACSGIKQRNKQTVMTDSPGNGFVSNGDINKQILDTKEAVTTSQSKQNCHWNMTPNASFLCY